MAQRSVQYLNTAVIKALRVEASSVGEKRSFGGEAQKDDQCTDFQGGWEWGGECISYTMTWNAFENSKEKEAKKRMSNTRVPFTPLNLFIFPKVERKFSSTTF